MRAVLEGVLRDEPDLVPIATVATARDALARARRLAPDVAVVDYHLTSGADGLSLARRLKALARPPRVLIYSAYADGRVTVAAIVAGADGIANKGGSGDDLCQAIRAVARGQRAFPPVPPTAVSATAARLDPSDVPILGMLAHGHLAAEIADALGITEPALDARRWAILTRLTATPRRPGQASPTTADRSMARPALAHQITGACAMTASPSEYRAERAPHRAGAREGAPQTILATTGRAA